MNCPVCGREMTEGKVAYQPACGLHFLPPSEKLPLGVTKRGIEKRGGVCLDGPHQLSNLTGDGELPAWLCRICRKMAADY